MKAADFTTNPVWDEWTMDVEAKVGCGFAQDSLKSRGYRLLEPVKETDGVYTMLASLDQTIDAAKRTNGKLMLAAAVGVTFVLLMMMAQGFGGERTVVPILLLATVILGGMGMNRLREPARRRRKLMEVTISPMPDGGCRVLAKGALIPDAASAPAPSAPQEKPDGGALLEDLRASESKDKRGEKR